jgi:TolA-binding protein
MSHAIDRRPRSLVTLLLALLALSTACGRRRRVEVSDETRRRIEHAIADEWDRQEGDDVAADDGPADREPAPTATNGPIVVDVRTPPPAAAPADTPMDQARACFRRYPDAMAAGDACAVNALRGRATTEAELGLLATTYRAMGRRADATGAMREYIARYPDGPRAPSFSAYIDRR